MLVISLGLRRLFSHERERLLVGCAESTGPRTRSVARQLLSFGLPGFQGQMRAEFFQEVTDAGAAKTRYAQLVQILGQFVVESKHWPAHLGDLDGQTVCLGAFGPEWDEHGVAQSAGQEVSFNDVPSGGTAG